MDNANSEIKRVFLIDDDPDDFLIFEMAIKEAAPNAILKWWESSSGFLAEMETFLPDLIFLDINIPGKSGFECLNEIQQHPLFRKTPVVMYTSSDQSKDVNISYGLGATLFVQKPPELKETILLLHKVFSLNWERPSEITATQYDAGNYLAYKA